MLYVSSLILVHSFFASADAFVRPITITFIQTSSTLSPYCGQQYQHQYYNPSLSLLELSAAKKKKKAKQKNKPASSSGKKGFGQSDYSATATSIDEVPVESSTSTSSISGGTSSSSTSTSTITTISSDSDSRPPIHQDLLTWLNQHPNTYVSPKFTIQPSQYGGYGGFVVSSSSLSLPVLADELLFRIPRECCVTYIPFYMMFAFAVR